MTEVGQGCIAIQPLHLRHDTGRARGAQARRWGVGVGARGARTGAGRSDGRWALGRALGARTGAGRADGRGRARGARTGAQGVRQAGARAGAGRRCGRTRGAALRGRAGARGAQAG